MVAKYTIKIGDRYYKAGETLPENGETKAVSTHEVEPPVSVVEEVAEQPKQKRQYTRRK